MTAGEDQPEQSSRTTPAGSAAGSVKVIAAASFPARRASRRITSTARRFAVTSSQARGLSGTPSRGHVSGARTTASCAASPASSTLPVTRISVARTRVPSSRTRRATASPACTVGRPGQNLMTGRTSAAPSRAAGIFAATATASSRSAHSSRYKPVSASLVSA
jgi:hypothetical protein